MNREAWATIEAPSWGGEVLSLEPLKDRDKLGLEPLPDSRGMVRRHRVGDVVVGHAVRDSWPIYGIDDDQNLPPKEWGCEVSFYSSSLMEVPVEKKNWTGVLFLDLDGTVRHGKAELGHFVNHPSDVVIFEGVVKMLQLYKTYGYRIVAITNQGGVAMGHMTLESLLENLKKTDELCGGLFDQMLFDTSYPKTTDGPRGHTSFGRKPAPGMIFDALYRLKEANPTECYSPYDCLYVGDRGEDRKAAEVAAIAFAEASAWRKLVQFPVALEEMLHHRIMSRNSGEALHDNHNIERVGPPGHQ